MVARSHAAGMISISNSVQEHSPDGWNYSVRALRASLPAVPAVVVAKT